MRRGRLCLGDSPTERNENRECKTWTIVRFIVIISLGGNRQFRRQIPKLVSQAIRLGRSVKQASDQVLINWVLENEPTMGDFNHKVKTRHQFVTKTSVFRDLC
jgi:hypothetical protein